MTRQPMEVKTWHTQLLHRYFSPTKLAIAGGHNKGESTCETKSRGHSLGAPSPHGMSHEVRHPSPPQSTAHLLGTVHEVAGSMVSSKASVDKIANLYAATRPSENLRRQEGARKCNATTAATCSTARTQATGIAKGAEATASIDDSS